MKKVGLVFLLCVSVVMCDAQTTGEWLQQKKTRIKYLGQQVAAFQVYIGDLKKGYRTVRNGLNIINDIKHGDFDLHHDYFNSLSSVSSGVRGYNKVQGITHLQKRIVEVSKALRKVVSSPFLLPPEVDYISAVMNNLLKKCSDDMDKLSLLTTSGGAQMKEEKRVNGINALYQSALDKYSFVIHLKESAQLLLLSRSKDKRNTSAMYSLYGLK